MKKYILIIAIFFAAGISACKKNYLDLEVNPNQPSVSPPNITLAASLAVAAAEVNGGDYSQYEVWVQWYTNSGNFVPNPALDQFQITNTSFTACWGDVYANLTNFNILVTDAQTDPTLSNYEAIAMIMKVYDFEQLVDQFGDVAYSQAFQPGKYLNPAYDAAQAIYDDFPKQLDAAMSLIAKGGGVNPGSSDIVFGGNMANWEKFANSLKLRIAIRQSKNSANTAAADLSSTASYGYLDNTVDAEANPTYANDLSNGNSQQSPFWANYGFQTTGNQTFPNTYYRGSNYYINLLTNTNDPRLNQVYTTPIGGNTFGQVGSAVLSNSFTSAIGPGLLISPTQNAVLMNSGEACFLLAEGALDGYVSGGTAAAQDYYQRGITASFAAMGLTAAQAAAYYGQATPNVGWAASSNKQEAIIYQKWIALTGYSPLEAYLEYERTGYPVLPNPVSADPAAVSAILPVRQYYPQSELNTNAAAVAKEGNINIFTTKIFWEK